MGMSYKLALFCTDLNWGGIQRVAVTLANAFSDYGLKVELIVLQGGGELEGQLSRSVELRILNCSKRSLYLLSPFSPLLVSIKRSKPDVLFAFGSVCNRIACWLKKLYRIKPLLMISEHTLISERLRCKNWLEQWRNVIRLRLLYSEASLCVCVSNAVKKDLEVLKILESCRMKVIYNPIFGPHISLLSQEGVPHPLFDKPSKPILLWAGRMVKIKGLEVLLRAFSILVNKMNIDASLFLLGDGPERNDLVNVANKLNIGDRVSFAGFSSNPYSYMEKSTLFVLSSLAEGFGNVLVEALACGTSIVSSDCSSGPREILEDGKYGKLVPVGDADAMAQAIKDVLERPYPKEKLRLRAAYFSVENSLKSYVELIEVLVADRSISL